MEESPASEFVDLFRALQKTMDIPERLELQGLATRGDDGELVLREDVREPFEDLEARLRASLDAGASYREAAEAAKFDVDHTKMTNVVYAIFRKDGGPGLYVGETSRTAARRFVEHPKNCKKLAEAFDGSDGGKDDWECVVLFALPEDARSKELLLHLEARLQNLLNTIDGPEALNCHCGAGPYGGVSNEDAWLSHYVDMIEFVAKHGRTPSTVSKVKVVKSLGMWVAIQRGARDEMPTHRRWALEALGSAWEWRINSHFVTNAIFFEKLRADARVTSSGGVDIPTDIPGVNALRVRSARNQYKRNEMPERDRAIVDAEFPGLKMTARNASFRLGAEAFAKKHPGAETFPSYRGDKALYRWLDGMRRGTIGMTSWRKKVLEDLGLAALLKTLKPMEFRAAVVSLNNAQTAERNAERDAARAEAREAKRQKRIDDIAAGPRSV